MFYSSSTRIPLESLAYSFLKLSLSPLSLSKTGLEKQRRESPAATRRDATIGIMLDSYR